jgi:hypothetical protein
MVLWLLGLAVTAGLAYAGSCWLYPFARCGRCEGSGKRSRADGQVFDLCRRCKGSGRRLRYGRRAWNHFHHQRARAVR